VSTSTELMSKFEARAGLQGIKVYVYMRVNETLRIRHTRLATGKLSSKRKVEG